MPTDKEKQIIKAYLEQKRKLESMLPKHLHEEMEKMNSKGRKQRGYSATYYEKVKQDPEKREKFLEKRRENSRRYYQTLKNERELAKKNFESGLIPELTNLDLADVPRRKAKKKEDVEESEQQEEDTMTETVSETVSESITDTQTQTASESESETEESSSVSEVPQVRTTVKQALFRRRL
jgi:hypothetical protein